MEVVLDRVSLSLQSRSWTGQVEAESKVSLFAPFSLDILFQFSDFDFFVLTFFFTFLNGYQILHSISATVERGKLLGVMGGSGSGKTSLIDVIMGRAAGSISGRVTFDGVDPAPLIPKLCAYVKQGDFLLPHLTCRETLQFAARLRLPAELSDEEREQRVEEVITELGLKDCADTRVGNEYARGLSGGEKRRVSIGVQLLTDPKLLILDEPTTGLDSFTAHNLVEYLVKLAAQGRTIICSIHQPRSDIFQLFDSIMLLARGHIVYSGPTSGVVSHFEKLGVPCPEHTNPADIILDAISVDPRTPQSEASSRQRLKSFILAWQAHSATSAEAAVVVPADTHEQVPIVFPTRASWPRQVVILTHRACLNLWRDRLTTLGYLAEMLVISVLLGIIFYHIPTDLISGIRSRVAVLYLLSSMQSYLLLIFALYILVDELAVFDRERSDHMYEAIPWVISRWLSTSVLNILLPIIFSLIVYSMVGLRTDLPGYQNFWVFVLVQVAIQHCCTAMAIFCASINRPFAKSSLLANSIYTFTVLSSGFFAQTTTIPSYISWFQYISWPHWGLRILAANEFTDNVFPCVGPIDVTSLPLNATAAAIATNTAFCKQYFDGASVC
jgi:ABC-type multidrug transport system ATPase subunit